MNSTNKHRKPLTREDISQYVSSQDERVKHRIERQSQRSDFESEALEGWSSSSLPLTRMKQMDKKFSPSGSATGITLSVIALVAIAVTGILLFNQSSDVQPPAPVVQPITLKVEKTDIVLPERIDSMTNTPEAELIPAKQIRQDFKEKIATPASIDQSEKNVKSELKVEQLPLIKVDLPKREQKLKTLTAKEIYLSDLKLVDYRSYRSSPYIKTETLELTGVPANLEDAYSVTEESQWNEIDIPYIDYLRKSMDIFSKERYKQALSRFLKVLDTYPDDVNALFYSGLCYYNLNQPDMAVQQFHACLRSNYDNFYEESEWLLARSYEADGQHEKALSIYKLIVSKKGYYAAQAKKVLSE